MFKNVKLFSKPRCFHKGQRTLFTYFRKEFAGVLNVKLFSTHAFHEEGEGKLHIEIDACRRLSNLAAGIPA